MVGSDVEHGADVTAFIAKAAPQKSAAGGFQHGSVYGRVAQDHLGGHRPREVAL